MASARALFFLLIIAVSGGESADYTNLVQHARTAPVVDEALPSFDDHLRIIYEAIMGPHQPAFPRPAMKGVVRTSRPRKFILHHIWKCGGTHICDVARESGFRVPENPGCHRWTEPRNGDKYTPCALNPGLEKIKFDVIGHECAVDNQTLHKGLEAGFGWIGIIREPLEQAYSWMAMGVHGSPLKMVKDLRSFREWTQKCVPHGRCGFFTFFPNLQTRWLAGGPCVHDPELPGCVEMALERLKQMEAVLEQRGGHLMGQEKLVKFGWKAEKPSTKNWVSAGLSFIANATHEDLEFVKKQQHLDLRLHRAAKAAGLV